MYLLGPVLSGASVGVILPESITEAQLDQFAEILRRFGNVAEEVSSEGSTLAKFGRIISVDTFKGTFIVYLLQCCYCEVGLHEI